MRLRPSRELFYLAKLLASRAGAYFLMACAVACLIAALFGHTRAISIFLLVLFTVVAIITLVQNDQRNTATLAKLDLLLRELRMKTAPTDNGKLSRTSHDTL